VLPHAGLNFVMSSSLYSELRNIKNHKLSVYNRLKSIRQDADFIAELAVAFPRYPLIANIRYVVSPSA
jgi:hypothetical protein